MQIDGRTTVQRSESRIGKMTAIFLLPFPFTIYDALTRAKTRNSITTQM